MRLTYKKKIFLYFMLVFSVFTAIIVIVQQKRERTYKTEYLKANLNAYAEVVSNYIQEENLFQASQRDSLVKILPLLPTDLRLTIIDDRGDVYFDNHFDDPKELENHITRPEISKALKDNNGTHIRQSASIGRHYYYYARYFSPYFVRVAMPYNSSVKSTLEADDIFTYFILFLFFSAIISLLYLADRFGEAISGLNTFISSAEKNDLDYDQIKFPDTELGEIGNKIVTSYKMLEESKKQVSMEREKILRHLHHSDEGICIFSADHKKIYTNTHFIQYLNTITDEPILDVESIFTLQEFAELKIFLQQNTPIKPTTNSIPIWQNKIIKNGKHFAVKLLIFYDNSYEILLDNISTLEKNRLLKHEMTSNIAHELRTPISIIRGYIETILEQSDLDIEKQQIFLQRAYSQALRLTDLTRDIALITKTEEASELFEKEIIHISEVIQEVVSDLEIPLTNKGIIVDKLVASNVSIEGNYTLLYSIFRNFIDNTISYGGEKVRIKIENYTEDKEFYYFSYYDTGEGVDEQYLERLFDRFYRINEGRSRKTGGSGLGLAIVKNAILFHNGQISAKNRKDRGLEFIFSLSKTL